MAGISIHVDLAEFDREIVSRLQALAELDTAEALDVLGQTGVSQTQQRISVEKTAPDGTAWKPNFSGTSILFLEGELNRSIVHEVESETEVSWGSNRVYAAIHQLGGKIVPKNKRALQFKRGGKKITVRSVTIPARPYLGFSDANKTELVAILNDWMAEKLA